MPDHLFEEGIVDLKLRERRHEKQFRATHKTAKYLPACSRHSRRSNVASVI
jgi:hypothetical protein